VARPKGGKNITIPPACHPDRKHWAKGQCRGCYLAAWQKSHAKQIKARTYGLSLLQLETMWEEQEGKCKLCLIPLEWAGKGKNKMCIDHDHKTGRVRGLLCDVCNRGLGFYERMVQFNLKDYL
jgi:hypothetical protein